MNRQAVKFSRYENIDAMLTGEGVKVEKSLMNKKERSDQR